MIRMFHTEDMENILQIWLQENKKAHAFLAGFNWEEWLEPVREAMLSAELYVYDSGEGILGFLGLSGSHIEGVFVDGRNQCKGIGKELLLHAKGLRARLTLNVYLQNARAVQFYKREGFVPIREQVDTLTGAPELIMEWCAAPTRASGAFPEAELLEAQKAVLSTIRKNEKALQSLSLKQPPRTAQMQAVTRQLGALRLAHTLLARELGDEALACVTKQEVAEAREEIEALLNRVEKVFPKLKEGSPQATLTARRIHAFRMALALMNTN